LGTPATVVLRMIVLKHLSDWSFDLLARLVALGRERRVVRGRRLRIDTVVVETNIHFATDAMLLADVSSL